jgi:hypothetical protein
MARKILKLKIVVPAVGKNVGLFNPYSGGLY